MIRFLFLTLYINLSLIFESNGQSDHAQCLRFDSLFNNESNEELSTSQSKHDENIVIVQPEAKLGWNYETKRKARRRGPFYWHKSVVSDLNEDADFDTDFIDSYTMESTWTNNSEPPVSPMYIVDDLEDFATGKVNEDRRKNGIFSPTSKQRGHIGKRYAAKTDIEKNMVENEHKVNVAVPREDDSVTLNHEEITEHFTEEIVGHSNEENVGHFETEFENADGVQTLKTQNDDLDKGAVEFDEAENATGIKTVRSFLVEFWHYNDYIRKLKFYSSQLTISMIRIYEREVLPRYQVVAKWVFRNIKKSSRKIYSSLENGFNQIPEWALPFVTMVMPGYLIFSFLVRYRKRDDDEKQNKQILNMLTSMQQDLDWNKAAYKRIAASLNHLREDVNQIKQLISEPQKNIQTVDGSQSWEPTTQLATSAPQRISLTPVHENVQLVTESFHYAALDADKFNSNYPQQFKNAEIATLKTDLINHFEQMQYQALYSQEVRFKEFESRFINLETHWTSSAMQLMTCWDMFWNVYRSFNIETIIELVANKYGVAYSKPEISAIARKKMPKWANLTNDLSDRRSSICSQT